MCILNTFGYFAYRYGNKIENVNYRTSGRQIWLDNVQCTGEENDIRDCTHGDWGVHNCQHREDVALSCGSSNGILLFTVTPLSAV